MKTYKAYLNQGGGCDYTIGCGETIYDIQADSMEDAKQKLAVIISEEYNSDNERELESAELFEVEQVFVMDVKAIYQKREADKIAEFQRRKDEKEKQEFERLKSKFGNG